MRIAEKQVGPHPAELFEREQSQFVHPIVNERATLRLGGEYSHQADEVARESRPESGGDFSSRLRYGLFDAKHVGVHRALDVQPLQHGRDHFHVFSAGAADFDLPFRHRGDNRPAARPDIVAPETMVGAVEHAAALDLDRRRARPGDAGAQLGQEMTELDHVRLARRVTDL